MRLFYRAVYASSDGVPSEWNGNIATCNAGDTSTAYKAAVQRRINWYRAMAGVPANVVIDASLSASAQQEALFVAMTGDVGHQISSGTCFSTTAATAAAYSNLSNEYAGPDSIDAYMAGTGYYSAERRWLLFPQAQTMGTGDMPAAQPRGLNWYSSIANALWVQDGSTSLPRPAVRDGFVAWPAKGYAPFTTVPVIWSFSYPGADFSAATVSMTENGTPITSCQQPVRNGAGENTLAWIPKCMYYWANWARPAADTTYQVTVSNIVGAPQSSVTYNVTVFDPDVASATDGPLVIGGDASVPIGQPARFTFSGPAGTTAYQWRLLTQTPFSLNDGAESGLGNFTATTAGGYNMVATDVRATGAASFHLAQMRVLDESLQLKQVLGIGAPTVLNFKSRLAQSSNYQTALVEASLDDGQSWETLWQQAGGSVEWMFTAKTISLAAFANRTMLLRFRYTLNRNGIYYFPGADTGYGWYIDDVQISNATAVTASPPTETANSSIAYTPSSVGTLLLQGRAGMDEYFAEWGSVRPLTVTSNPSDCLFDWAERQFPTLLAPHGASHTSGAYYFRYYAASDSYVGTSATDGHTYFMQAGVLNDLGPTSTWLTTASCH